MHRRVIAFSCCHQKRCCPCFHVTWKTSSGHSEHHESRVQLEVSQQSLSYGLHCRGLTISGLKRSCKWHGCKHSAKRKLTKTHEQKSRTDLHWQQSFSGSSSQWNLNLNASNNYQCTKMSDHHTYLSAVTLFPFNRTFFVWNCLFFFRDLTCISH